MLRGKAFSLTPSPQSKACSVLRELLGQASCIKVAGLLSNSLEWRECGCHGNSNHTRMRGRSERQWIHLQVYPPTDLNAGECLHRGISASLTIVIININLVSQDSACFEITKGVKSLYKMES